MADLARRIRTRVMPALLTAFGVTLLAGGLLSYTDRATAKPLPSPTPTIVSAPPTATPLITIPPLASTAAPSASPSAPADRIATRVRIAALKIDLPVVAPPPGDSYPLCNVAMYLSGLGQPGQGRATFLYAHARTGLFRPLLVASLVNDGDRI